MTPSQAANELRRIAAAIDNSKKPHPRLVAADLRGLVQRLAQEEQEEQEETVSQEQQAMPRSAPGKQMLGEAIDAAKEALGKGDPHGLNKAIENINRAHKPTAPYGS